MPTGKTCGRCVNFQRIKDWGNGRNGLCNLHDNNCHSDSSYDKRCKKFKNIKYERIKKHNINRNNFYHEDYNGCSM